MEKQAKLGTGVRFKKLANKFAHKGIDNPAALAASVGRKKFGKEKFQRLATSAKKKKSQ